MAEEGGFEEEQEADEEGLTAAGLLANKQQTKVAQERAAQEQRAREQAAGPSTSAAAISQGAFAFNQIASKAALASFVLAFLWFPFKLVVADLSKWGKGLILPVTWDDLWPKFGRFLPNFLAKGVAGFMLAVDLVIVPLVALLSILTLYLYAKSLEDPYGTIIMAKSIFGEFACTVLTLMGHTVTAYLCSI